MTQNTEPEATTVAQLIAERTDVVVLTDEWGSPNESGDCLKLASDNPRPLCFFRGLLGGNADDSSFHVTSVAGGRAVIKPHGDEIKPSWLPWTAWTTVCPKDCGHDGQMIDLDGDWFKCPTCHTEFTMEEPK